MKSKLFLLPAFLLSLIFTTGLQASFSEQQLDQQKPAISKPTSFTCELENAAVRQKLFGAENETVGRHDCKVRTHPYDETCNLFYVAIASDDKLLIQHVGTGKLLFDVDNEGNGPGHNVRLHAQNHEPRDQWHLIPRNGFYLIQNAVTGYYLRVYKQYKSDYDVRMEASDSGTEALWSIIRQK